MRKAKTLYFCIAVFILGSVGYSVKQPSECSCESPGEYMGMSVIIYNVKEAAVFYM